MNIYTKRGDDGTTSLLGGECTKDDPRCHAYGDLDELSSWLGLLGSLSEVTDPVSSRPFDMCQHIIFRASAYIAAVPPAKPNGVRDIAEDDVTALEWFIDATDSLLPELKNFIYPAGHPLACHCHVARTVCRRAERSLSRLQNLGIEFNPMILICVNRMSDLLFVMSRRINQLTQTEEKLWKTQKE